MQPIHDISPTRSFKQGYRIALSLTALLFFLGYYLLTVTLSEETKYVSLTRLISKQNLINQEIDKHILLLQHCGKEKECARLIKETENILNTFKVTHQDLTNRHTQLYKPKQNPTLDSLYKLYIAYYQPITKTIQDFVGLKKELTETRSKSLPTQLLERKIDLHSQKIIYQESNLTEVLRGMTLAYSQDTENYIRNIQFYQTLVLVLGLLVLLLEGFLLFKPMVEKLERHMKEVKEAQSVAEKQTLEATQSYHQIKEAEEKTRLNAEKLQEAHDKLLSTQARLQEVNRELVEKNWEIQENNDLRQINKELEEARFFDGSLNHFAEVMRWQANETIYSWSENVLKELVPFFKGLQGVLYAYDNEKNSLYVTGSFATDQETLLQKNEVRMGENLVGQVAKSCKVIYFEHLNGQARNFMTSTATEEISPEALIIQPLLFNHQLAGVLEITALQAWEARYVELLQRMNESIGSNLSTLQDQMRINQLFADSQMAEKKLKRSLSKLKENEERFRKLAELTQEGLLFLQDDLIKDLNGVVAQMFGYESEKDLQHTHYIELIAPSYRFEIEHNQLLADGLLHETMAQRKNHDTFPIEIQSREVKYGQEVVTVISIRDITIRKRTEKELEEANRIASLAAELEKKNKDVMSSIEYARRIQQAILPSEGAIGKGFVENFVLYLPRDIVSGDFYWFAEKNEHSLIAAVDCTGHGVPGAFMSIIGHSNLNKIVVEQGYTEPDAILRKLDREITAALKQQEGDSESRDGMDVALCSLNIYEGILSFAGAQRAMYVVRNGEILEFKGDSFSMGGNFKSKKKQKEFTKHEIALEKDDTIYIFSDGYPDQFGGLENRKFTTKQFKELLIRIQTYSLEEQKDILKREFDIWKGSYKQMDDVMVIGLKF